MESGIYLSTQPLILLLIVTCRPLLNQFVTEKFKCDYSAFILHAQYFGLRNHKFKILILNFIFPSFYASNKPLNVETLI